MNKILFTLSLLLMFYSCKTRNKKITGISNLPQNTTFLQINPQQFINKLPHELAENSGIIFYKNLLWTFNDSGGKNKIYAFNLAGKIEKKIEIKDAKNDDWEDIAQDNKYIYIGDFGNNSGTRRNQRIFKIKKKDIGKKSKQKIEAKEIKFSFENQTNYNFQGKNTPFDCEAMIALDGNLYIFTKDWANRTTTVYKTPTKKGGYKIRPIEKFNATGLITGADLSPNQTKLALLGYKNYKPILWLFSGFSRGKFFNGKKTYLEMDSIFDAQTEGVCFLGNDSLLISCERSASFNEQVFLIDLKTIE